MVIKKMMVGNVQLTVITWECGACGSEFLNLAEFLTHVQEH